MSPPTLAGCIWRPAPGLTPQLMRFCPIILIWIQTLGLQTRWKLHAPFLFEMRMRTFFFPGLITLRVTMHSSYPNLVKYLSSEKTDLRFINSGANCCFNEWSGGFGEGVLINVAALLPAVSLCCHILSTLLGISVGLSSRWLSWNIALQPSSQPVLGELK